MKRMSSLRVAVVLVAGLLALFALEGCAVGNRYRFGAVVANAKAAGNSTVATATIDQREYVRSGAKRPQFVGIQRGGYGNPFNVTTESGKPLADDVSDAISASLRRKGFRAAPVYVAASQPESAARERLLASGSDLLILVVLNELKTDTYTNVAFTYDVTVSVFDRSGRSLATVQFKDRKDLGGSAMNPPAHARRAVPIAFKGLLETILNNDSVGAALEGRTAAPVGCEKDLDCPGEQVCVVGACKEPAPRGGKCEKDTECKGDRICIKGECAAPK